MKQPFASLACAVLLVACQDAPPPTAVGSPALSVAAGSADVIPGRFIITLRSGASPEAVAQEHGVAPQFVYRHALNGFAGAIATAAREGLLRDSRVLRVEPDRVVHAIGTQSNATWGLDRIDQRELPLNSTYSYENTGSGVRAYIIDTGIETGHADFGARASSGYDAIDGGAADDCNGHGTHVAGTVGGTAWGVAKGVALVAVRVLDCAGSGTTSGVIAGVDWVTANHVKPAVANMSLGGGASSSLDQAVQNSINAGVSYAIAAGNGNWAGRAQDACNYSPARVGAAMTIGATDKTDTKASWSNYGACVDWFAPGVGITSAWHTDAYSGDGSFTRTISGTSMAAPHVAGAAAVYLQSNANATPQQVRDALYALTTKSIVKSSNTANNHLLYSPASSGGSTNQPPTASFAYSCSQLSCSFTDQSSDDGSIASWSWNLGDGTSSQDRNPSHGYGAAGTYTVSLTVTDDAGATSTTSQNVTVSTSSSGGISLSVVGYKTQGMQKADLSWSGATSTNVDVYRDGIVVQTTANDGAYTDPINRRGGGSYTYTVCEAGTSTCSSNVTVTF